MLKDDLEDFIANYFRPYYKFDSNEIARRDPSKGDPVTEPVTLFQVRPIGCIECDYSTSIYINWAFLFEYDGGYGPCSWCGDDHPGDNDRAQYHVKVTDNGHTLQIDLIELGIWHNPPLSWPFMEWWLEVYEESHLVIYMSASKHHMYFNTEYHCENSFYSEWGCNDDVNGEGDAFLSDLKSHFKDDRYNNVGEPENHPDYFVNELWEFPGESAWGEDPFFDLTPMGTIWGDWGFTWKYRTELCGEINRTLTAAEAPYLITCDVTIPTGETVNVDPGVVIRFSSGTKMTAYGTLNAINDKKDFTTNFFAHLYPKNGITVHPGGALRALNDGAIKFH